MNTDTVKGFKDFTGEEARKREKVRKILVETFEKYSFEPAETPIIEYEEFVRGQNQNDEAVSEIFKLKDRGKRKLALRYEFTFQLKRIAQGKKLPYKRYQIGPVFRDEPVSENRFRQFTQCDVDTIGSTIKDEAEILALTSEILKSIGISPLILINNRKLMDEILSDNGISEKNKTQVLREIDKYDKLPESQVRELLRNLDAENVLDSLKKGEKYFSQFQTYKKIISLMEYCKAYGLKVNFAPSIVRGLSYYNGSVFEIKANGVKESLVAGGSYKVGEVQATGLSFGLERICKITKLEKSEDKFLIVSLDQDRQAINLLNKLRTQGKTTSIFYGKPSKALEYANSCKINNVIFVGAKEVKAKKFKVKDMKTGRQKTLVIQKVTKKNVLMKKKG
ncbi:MAG: ATP phosphoribosyltransferase regulatory subunit [Nanoarchaeota archaeon]|nr:ATP phosphoribosyltransferase regulatory subunit [Nanoarchaeota archaeon]MBU1027728.1 ATP phosphoribosyltransferase regulatory subunit [Nanoarchaeota archaeon]